MKSFPIRNTGNLSCESLTAGLVAPFKSTSGDVKVNYPNLGMLVPFPNLMFLAMNFPRADQISCIFCSSLKPSSSIENLP